MVKNMTVCCHSLMLTYFEYCIFILGNVIQRPFEKIPGGSSLKD